MNQKCSKEPTVLHRTMTPRVEKVGSKGAIQGGLGAGRDAVLATLHAHGMKISGSGLYLTKGLCCLWWPYLLNSAGQAVSKPWESMTTHSAPGHPDTPWHTLTHPDISWHTLKNVCGHGSPRHLPWLVQNAATLAWRFWLYGQQHSIMELGFITIALPCGSRSSRAPCSVVWLSFCVPITIINKNCLHLNFLFLMG